MKRMRFERRHQGRARSYLSAAVLLASLLGTPGVMASERCWQPNWSSAPELHQICYLEVTAHDGVILRGWIGLPHLSPGERVPVLLSSSPYLSEINYGSDPDEETYWTATDAWRRPIADSWGVPLRDLLRRRYALAFFSVRGTSESGGCVDWMGPDEQRDQELLVEWLGDQAAHSWSNGAVAMGGRSYMSGTAFEAAMQNPGPLKAIVVTGVNTDQYSLWHTPQGAEWSIAPAWAAGVAGETVGNPDSADVMIRNQATRLCDSFAESIAFPAPGYVTDERPEAFYLARRLIDRLPETRVPVLISNGLRDHPVQVGQDDLLWSALRQAPKRAVLGYWAHEHPTWMPLSGGRTWAEELFSWLDYWLKDIGAQPQLTVEYQLGADIPWWDINPSTAPPFDPGDWRETTAWPPPEAHEEVIYLAGRSLSPTTGAGSRSFLSTPATLNDEHASEFVVPFAETILGTGPTPVRDIAKAFPTFCPSPEEARGVLYTTEPLQQDIVLAGNPLAYLRLSSTQPGGIVGVHLLSLPADFDCTGEPHDVHLLSLGAADLRFWKGNFKGEDFETGTPQNVRVDLLGVSERVPAGRRLAVAVSYGEVTGWSSGQPFFPRITIHSDGGLLASHLVLPFVESSLGGSAPTVDYPPHPVFTGTGD